MATPNSMILRALQMTGEKAIGGSLTSAEQTAHLANLNAMMESLSLNRALCYQIVQESFSLVAGTSSYTIGSGGTFATDRPNKIVDPCYTIDSSNNRTPLTLINAEAYRRLPVELSGNTYPSHLFYDSAYVTGLATIFLYPKPQASLTLYINSWKQLQTFASISTTVVLPPGYQRMIESNYAIEAAAGAFQVSPEVIKIAKESLAAIKSLNIPDTIMRLDMGAVQNSHRSILTG